MLKSHLSFYRPHIMFDIENPVHRKAYFDFTQTGTWSACPYNFIVEDPYVDLPSMINTKMAKYYMNKEFTKTNRLSRKYSQENQVIKFKTLTK